MGAVAKADGLQIFIGSDHDLFAQTGCAMVLSPYRDSESDYRAVGVIAAPYELCKNYPDGRLYIKGEIPARAGHGLAGYFEGWAISANSFSSSPARLSWQKAGQASLWQSSPS